MSDWKTMNRWLSVQATGCTVTVTGTAKPGSGDTSQVAVTDMTDGCYLTFRSVVNFAAESWFHWQKADKNVYFDNYVEIEDPGAAQTENKITFNSVDQIGSAQIQTKFDVVNYNGAVDDPTLILNKP